ncbi:MAG: TetR/AcrR family transcriptional regulator C-terminal domain-containing protein [Deltaproteobacteria bacterium]|jgi:probable dihydroxyacetone kinase regulator|nr:TetR/AcrR family transcriptional regulator C-terminal domain-containing protein [Deltaproteobacteria bacterium]
MSNNVITKEALATALKNLIRTKGLAKISVKDITDHCKVSRNTFYYHFTDKTSLIKWIFYTETLREINTFTESHLWLESFVNLCKYFCENNFFYIEAFKSVGQNTLQNYLMTFYYELLKLHIDTEYKQLGIVLGDDELMVSARMETHAFVGIIMDWINEGMNPDYMKYYEQLKLASRINKILYTACSEDLQREIRYVTYLKDRKNEI